MIAACKLAVPVKRMFCSLYESYAIAMYKVIIVLRAVVSCDVGI